VFSANTLAPFFAFFAFVFAAYYHAVVHACSGAAVSSMRVDSRANVPHIEAYRVDSHRLYCNHVLAVSKGASIY